MSKSENLDVSVGQASHVGLVRKKNEDSFGWFSFPAGELFIVADGMGGYAGGAEASKRTVLSFKEYFEAHQGDPRKTLQEALLYADAKVQEIGKENPSLSRCGSTIVAFFISGTAGYFIHAGDSRLYVFHKGRLTQIGRDHSAVQEMLQAGIISKKEAEKAPKNVITQSVGGNIDAARCVVEQFAIEPGSSFLLCSDGLWGPVSHKKLEEILSQPISSASKVNQMINAAVDAGGPDNITAQVIEFGAPDSQTQPTPAKKIRRTIAAIACTGGLLALAAIGSCINKWFSDPEPKTCNAPVGKEEKKLSNPSVADEQDSEAVKPSSDAGAQSKPATEGSSKEDTDLAKPSSEAVSQKAQATEGKSKGNADLAKSSSDAATQKAPAAKGKSKGNADPVKPSSDAKAHQKPASEGKNIRNTDKK